MSAMTTYDIDADRKELDVSDKIARSMPDASPFTVMLMRARKKVTDAATIIWYDEEPAAWWTQINNGAGYLSTDTTLTVDDSTVFKIKDIVKVTRTGETMYVSAIPSGTSITVTRGYGTTAAAALLDNDWLMQLGNAMEENSLAPDTSNPQPAKFSNYIQEYRTPFDASDLGTEIALKTTEDDRTRLRKTKSIEHRIGLERIALFGEKKEDVTNKRRATGGINSFITTNKYDVSGILTESEFETSICEAAFKYGSSRKLLVGCPRAISVINQFAQGKLQTQPKAETYGTHVQTYVSGHGLLDIVKSPVLEKGYDGYAFIVDMENIQYRPFKGFDTKLAPNIQENDRHGWKDEYYTIFGMQVRLEKTHMQITGITG